MPAGALSDRRKSGLVEEFSKLVRDAAGLTEEDGVRVWVLIHEVPEGNWGAAGQIVRFEQLRAAAKAEREKAEGRRARRPRPSPARLREELREQLADLLGRLLLDEVPAAGQRRDDRPAAGRVRRAPSCRPRPSAPGPSSP